jgi:hypothetical protein
MTSLSMLPDVISGASERPAGAAGDDVPDDPPASGS